MYYLLLVPVIFNPIQTFLLTYHRHSYLDLSRYDYILYMANIAIPTNLLFHRLIRSDHRISFQHFSERVAELAIATTAGNAAVLLFHGDGISMGFHDPLSKFCIT